MSPALAKNLRPVWRVVVGLFGVSLGVTGALLPWAESAASRADAAWRTVPVVRVFGMGGTTVPAWVSPDSQLENVVHAHPGARPVLFAPGTEAGRASEAVLTRPDGSRVSVFVSPHLGGIIGERPHNPDARRWLRAVHTGDIAGQTGMIAVALLSLATFLAFARDCAARRASFARRVIAAAALAYLVSVLAAAPLTGRTLQALLTAIHVGWPREANADAHHSTPTVWKHPQDPPSVAATAPPRRILVMEHDETGAMVSEKVVVDPSTTATPAIDAPPRRGPPDPATLEWCGAVRGSMDMPLPPISLARVALIAAEQNMPAPYVITLPTTDTSVFTLTTRSVEPAHQAVLHLDQYEGTVLADVRGRDVRAPGRFAAWLAAAHDGTASGVANRIAVSLAALALVAGSLVHLTTARRVRRAEGR